MTEVVDYWDEVEPIAYACDTPRCRLPIPSGDADRWVEVYVSGLRGSAKDAAPGTTVKVQVCTSYLNDYYEPAVRERECSPECEFTACSDGFIEVEGTVTFPTLAVAVAHMMSSYETEFLNLPAEHATRWDALHHRLIERLIDGPDAWRRSETERADILAAKDAAELADAIEAEALLDAEVRRLTGQSFGQLLASSCEAGLDWYCDTLSTRH